MSRTGPTRNELVAAIIAQGRANSTGTVLLHAAVAERLGLNPSDHKCADLMMSQSEACTPGRLAELTGLSTGAITGVIDRLEGAGFLVREHDAEDRRRVLLRLTHTRTPELHALFAPLARGVEVLCEKYTIAELAVVLRYMREVRVVTDDIAQSLRSGVTGLRGVGTPAEPSRAAERRAAALRGLAERAESAHEKAIAGTAVAIRRRKKSRATNAAAEHSRTSERLDPQAAIAKSVTVARRSARRAHAKSGAARVESSAKRDTPGARVRS
jgi:DNA-binding MarR family transcriptional regulator